MKDYFKEFEENEIFKGKVTIKNCEIILKIHSYFVVKYKGNDIYLNDKFYFNIEEHDLFDYLCDFADDNDTIYVQYKHYHFKFCFGYSGYFKEIKKVKYSLKKLRHKKDIELIFDNRGVIFSKKLNIFQKIQELN